MLLLTVQWRLFVFLGKQEVLVLGVPFAFF